MREDDKLHQTGKDLENEAPKADDMPKLQDERTLGEKVIGINFQPGNNDEVQNAKEHAAHFINSISKINIASGSSLHQRLITRAIDYVEEASMLATKAKFTK